MAKSTNKKRKVIVESNGEAHPTCLAFPSHQRC